MDSLRGGDVDAVTASEQCESAIPKGWRMPKTHQNHIKTGYLVHPLFGYELPLVMSQTCWYTFYSTSSHLIQTGSKKFSHNTRPEVGR